MILRDDGCIVLPPEGLAITAESDWAWLIELNNL